MEKNVQDLILLELNRLIEILSQKKLEIQQSKNFLKSIFYSKSKLHRMPKQCIYFNCENKSIRRSHSIPKSSCLNTIATDGHLFHPIVQSRDGSLEMVMKPIGINNASVFPGYCKEHEKLFQIYEHNSEMNDEKKVSLQAYRALCREIVFFENQLKIYQGINDKYGKKIEVETFNILNRRLKEYDNSFEMKNIRLNGCDFTLTIINDLINYVEHVLRNLKLMEKSFLNKIKKKEVKSKIFQTSTFIDYVFPVSLCGFASIGYEIDNEKKEMLLVLNIIPNKNKTYILFSSSKEHKEMYNQYVKFNCQNPLSILNMIESFMINGSDHWFISPSYWEKIPEVKQKIILKDILQKNNNITDEYPISIFDDIRQYFIKIFEKNTKQRKLTKDEEEFINKEKTKLYNHENWIELSDDELYKQLLNIIQLKY